MELTTVAADTSLWTWNETGQQEDFFNDVDTRFCAFVGGNGAGKSYVGARKAANLLLYNAFDDAGQATYCNGLLVSESYQLSRTLNIPQMEEAFREMGLSFSFNASGLVYAFVMHDLGTRAKPVHFYVRSATAGKSIIGFEVGTVWGDEAAKWYHDPLNPSNDALIQADRRLRQKGARTWQFNMTYTNEGDNTSVYKRFEKDRLPHHSLYRGSTRDNVKHLGDNYIETFEATMAADLVQQYIDGGVAILGRHNVYYVFDEKRNVKPVELVRGNPLDLAIDFNINPGMHAVVGQHLDLPKRLLTATHVIHEARMNVRVMMDRFDRMFGQDVRDGKYPFVNLFGDATGNAEGIAEGTSLWDVVREELTTRSIPFKMMVPAVNPRLTDRSNHMNSAFLNARGEVRYLVNPRCELLIGDFKAVKWDGKKFDKTDVKLSHPSDADGYRTKVLLPIRRPEPRKVGRVLSASSTSPTTPSWRS